jgi:prolyl-tRNA synthetase
MMGDRRALQAGTSHYMGQNFARAFNIQYTDRSNAQQYCYTTSWGFSTRVIGAVVMVHGDDQGLILPPRLAPTQAVIVPIWKSDEERTAVLALAEQVRAALSDLRVRIDARDGLTPGFKFNEWELRGVPLRIEIGPKDVAAGQVVLARRDVPGRAGKAAVALAGLRAEVGARLDTIQQALYDRALAFREAHTYRPEDQAGFREAIENGFAQVWWCERRECEEQIKDETRATSRCILLDQPGGTGRCAFCGEPARRLAVFARAY